MGMKARPKYLALLFIAAIWSFAIRWQWYVYSWEVFPFLHSASEEPGIDLSSWTMFAFFLQYHGSWPLALGTIALVILGVSKRGWTRPVALSALAFVALVQILTSYLLLFVSLRVVEVSRELLSRR